MTRPQRGQLWFVRLDPTEGHEQSKTRPCLVISNNKFNHSVADLIIVVPVTSKNKHLSLHVPIDSLNSGLATDSFVMPEQIRAVSLKRFVEMVGFVQYDVLMEVEKKIKLLLDF